MTKIFHAISHLHAAPASDKVPLHMYVTKLCDALVDP